MCVISSGQHDTHYHAHSQIVCYFKSHNVDRVTVDGEIVMKEGWIRTLREERNVKNELIERSDSKGFR